MTEMTIGWAIVISCDSTWALVAGTDAEDRTVVVARIPNRIVVIFIVFYETGANDRPFYFVFLIVRVTKYCKDL